MERTESRMRNIFLSICFLLLVGGCAKVSIEKEMLDGTVLRAEYVRIWDQEMSGFKLKSPEGWELSFDNQSADIALAFKAGVFSATVGDPD